MPDLTVSSDLDALLAKQTLAEAKTYLGVTANATDIATETTRATAAEGVNATGIAFNTAKVGITPTQASAIAANTVKTGITLAQASAITVNTAKVGITPTQASAITVNTAKVGITPTQASAITDNTAAIVTEAGIRADADTANATAISTETTRALAAEGVNATAISDETTRATAAEGVNATAISTETSRATAAEGVNATAISDETTRATAAEVVNAAGIATNATDIATETTRATAAEGVNATAIAAEAVIRADADVVGYNMIVANTTAISDETTRATTAEALLAPIDDPTFTGTVTAPLINAGSIDFNAGAGNGGEVSWNNTEKTLNLVTGSDNVTIQVGQEVVLYCRNTTGAQLTDGQVVKVIGSQGNNPLIALAQADTPANARGVIGVVTQIIPDNSNGFISLIGKVRDLTLDGGTYAVGDLLYLSSTVAGGLTKVRPDIGVEIGRVISISTGGNNAGVLSVSINNEVAVHELEQDVIANTTAIGVNATAILNHTNAIFDNATNIGLNSTAIGLNSTAIGLNSTAIGVNATAISDETTRATTAEGINATAIIDNYAATPHNTDSVIICNNGDNIQDKYDEAAVLSISNKVTLLLMAGTYGDLAISDAAEGAYGVDVIGVGAVSIGNLSSPSSTNPILSHFKNFTCSNLGLDTSFGIIEDIKVNGSFNVGQTLGIIRKVICSTFYTFLSYGTIDDIICFNTFTVDVGGNHGTIKNVTGTSSFVNFSNTGTIKNCESSLFLGIGYNDNQGIIDNCHSTGTSTIRSFFGNIGSSNQGTIRNCTAKGVECFGQQGVNGVTEYCTGGDRAFAGAASNLDFSNGQGIQGTYRNCVGGNLSFLGYNNTTNGIKTMEATYLNCTAGANSFGFVNTAGAETHFTGKAINCTGGTNSFLTANNGAAKILNGAVLENCIGGYNSFAGISGVNEGAILRCRTLNTANAFKATGTGKVRLCLDGNYNEVNLP